MEIYIVASEILTGGLLVVFSQYNDVYVNLGCLVS
jgi:hypothetical protein